MKITSILALESQTGEILKVQDHQREIEDCLLKARKIALLASGLKALRCQAPEIPRTEIYLRVRGNGKRAGRVATHFSATCRSITEPGKPILTGSTGH